MKKVAITGVTLGLLLGVFFTAQWGYSAAQKHDKWIYALANPNFLPGIAFIWVGDHPKLNFYKQEGIDMEWRGVAGATTCVQHLLRKQVDSCALIQDQVLLQAAEGNKFPITFVYDYTYKITNEFAVKPDSPVKNVSDLKGKKVGILSLAHDTYKYGQLVFQRLGFKPNDVEFLATGLGPQAAELLYQERVDALLLFDIVWPQFKFIGKPVRVLPQPDFIAAVKAGPIIAARTEDVKNRPDVIVRTFRAHTKSMLFTIENPEAALHIHFEMHPETLPKGLSYEKAFAQTLPVVEARLPAVEKKLADVQYYGEFNPEGWKAYVTDVLGLDLKKVNPADFYTNQFAKEINNFDEAGLRKWAREFKYKK